MGAAARLSNWARRLLQPPRPGGEWGISRAGESPVLWSGRPGTRPLVLSPGFGSSVFDYAPLADLFGRHQQVYRVGHPGSDRWAGFAAGARLLWQRFVRGQSALLAAQSVRSYLHRESSRYRRLRQLRLAAGMALRRGSATSIDLAGHSYGSDTALLLALLHGVELKIDTLYLFSPHPPDYLIPARDYVRLPVRRVVVVVGSRDRTRDGVGPEQRCLVAKAVGEKARLITLEGVAHMDFAFLDLGPCGWPEALARVLGL